MTLEQAENLAREKGVADLRPPVKIISTDGTPGSDEPQATADGYIFTPRLATGERVLLRLNKTDIAKIGRGPRMACHCHRPANRPHVRGAFRCLLLWAVPLRRHSTRSAWRQTCQLNAIVRPTIRHVTAVPNE